MSPIPLVQDDRYCSLRDTLDVALIGWGAILTTLANIVEEVYYIVGFREIFTADHIRAHANLNSPNPRLWVALTFGMSGFDLALFWISKFIQGREVILQESRPLTETVLPLPSDRGL